MPDIKISDATPIGTLDPTDLLPIARVGTNAPYNASLADIAAYVTVLASTHPPEMSDMPPTAGIMDQYARADHVHPPNSSLAKLDSPVFVGNPTAPTMPPTDNSNAIATTKFVHDLGASGTLRTQTPGIDDNSELVATTEFVLNQAWTQLPMMDGVPTAGASLRFSRGDHTHPVDTSRAAFDEIPLAATTLPTMDGTAAVGTGTRWARADHQHPSDVSRYATTNPAGYQTAAQVTATVAAARTGITDGSEAAPGQIGEYQSAQCLSTAAIALTSNTDTIIVPLPLTAGDWDLTASIGFTSGNNNSATLRAWINTTGGSIAPPVDQIGGNVITPVANNTAMVIMPLVPTRVNLTGPSTIRLGATVTMSGGAISGWGKLMARRRR